MKHEIALALIILRSTKNKISQFNIVSERQAGILFCFRMSILLNTSIINTSIDNVMKRANERDRER